jgi:HEAT repeat protein
MLHMAACFFCPDCWIEIAVGTKTCPHCGYVIAEYESLSYEKKLIRALRHPVRENRMMAIQVLGELRSRAALPMFASVLKIEEDFYVTREIILALEKIGGTESKKIIRRLKTHKSKLIRSAAKRL